MATIDPLFHDPAGHVLRLPCGCLKLCSYRVAGPVTWRDFYEKAGHDLACPDAQITALSVLPVSPMRQFGKVEGGSPIGGGDFLFLSRDRRDDIVVAAAKIGYVVIEDQLTPQNTLPR